MSEPMSPWRALLTVVGQENISPSLFTFLERSRFMYFSAMSWCQYGPPRLLLALLDQREAPDQGITAPLKSLLYMAEYPPSWRRFDRHLTFAADWRARPSVGSRTEIRRAMMPITTSSSTK